MFNKSLVLIIGLLFIIGVGCSQSIPSKPSDFSFEYNWSEGTIPPPYHYEYTIKVEKDGSGTLMYRPDYSENSKTPVWTEQLPQISEAEMDLLYSRIAETGLLKKGTIERENENVGGVSEWLEATMNGKKYEIKPGAEQTEKIKYLYERLHNIVPDFTWNKMEQQRQDYIKANYKSFREENP
jgi:hypothetical protein